MVYNCRRGQEIAIMTLAEFVDTLKGNAVWPFAWAALLGIVYFVSAFLFSLPEELAKLKTYEFQDDKKTAEFRTATDIFLPLLIEVTSKLLEAAQDFKERTQPDGRTVVLSEESA